MSKYKLIIPLFAFGIISFIFVFPKFIRMTFSGNTDVLMTWYFIPLSMFGALATFKGYLLIQEWLSDDALTSKGVMGEKNA